MKTYEKNILDRKVLVKRLEELTGTKGRYSFAPRMAYLFANCAVEKDGTLTVEDGMDMGLIDTLISEELIKPSALETADAAGTAEAAETAEALESAEGNESDEVSESAEGNESDEAEPTSVNTVEEALETAETAELNVDSASEDASEETETVAACLPESSAEAETEDWVPDSEYEQEAAAESAACLGITDADEQAEAGCDGLTISLPLDKHTPESLRRLLNLIYSRGGLISKATGGNFDVDKDLLTALDRAGFIRTNEEFVRKVEEHGGLTGITFLDGKLNYTGFPFSYDSAKTAAYQQLACAVSKHAIQQKRIQAKVVSEENEK
ncbi:MAG: hypothetical protein II515_08790, partial [Desulfovibrio sp.]|nr:hypothetical protein [Desulfovibrio sp.]